VVFWFLGVFCLFVFKWVFVVVVPAPWVLLFVEMMQSLPFVFNATRIRRFPAREGQAFQFPVPQAESLALFFCSVISL